MLSDCSQAPAKGSGCCWAQLRSKNDSSQKAGFWRVWQGGVANRCGRGRLAQPHEMGARKVPEPQLIALMQQAQQTLEVLFEAGRGKARMFSHLLTVRATDSQRMHPATARCCQAHWNGQSTDGARGQQAAPPLLCMQLPGRYCRPARPAKPSWGGPACRLQGCCCWHWRRRRGCV